MEKTVTLKPYDCDVADDVFSCLFRHTEHDREDGLTEMPSASYQLLISGMEDVLWELHGDDRDTIRRALAITERLRDEQKKREWNRREV